MGASNSVAPCIEEAGVERMVIEVPRQAAIPKGSAVKMTEKRHRSLPTGFTPYSQTARENEGCGPKEAFI